MLPWVILYGVTAFLFNHPTAFSDAPSAAFSRAELAGTPMAAPPGPHELAPQVVAALQKRAPAGTTYALVEPERAKFTRDFAFATVKADGQDLNLLFHVNGGGGTVRSRTAAAPKPPAARAPFAVGGRPGGPGGSAPRGGRGAVSPRSDDGLILDDPLHERVKASVPAVLERTGFPLGDVTVTSVPDLAFRMSDGEKVWNVTYNPQTGGVSGQPADAAPEPDPLSTRRFLLRLHLAHGYPGEVNAKWVWAVVVDAMAFIMVFWGASGLLMWWQIKATRRLGAVLVVVSAVAATVVGLGMHELLAAAGR
jgi:hypothetical protein